MRLLIVDSYYSAFWQAVYGRRPELADLPYDEQWQILMDQAFGTADYYSTNLRLLGHEAREIVANCLPLQRAWAREHGLKLPKRLEMRRYRGLPVPGLRRDWFYPVLRAQVEEWRPDVVHIQAPNSTSAAFLTSIRPSVCLITAQIATGLAPGVDYGLYDLVLSSFPHYVRRFNERGVRSAYFKLGFEPRILERLKPGPRYPVVFVGGLTRQHGERTAFLEALANHVPLHWWGYGAELLAAGSPLGQYYHGPAWGLDMYERLFNADIALNHHVDVAENYANNMRLYEATGVGSLLVTDWKENLGSQFDVGREVIAYQQPEDCADVIRHYLARPEERAAIARAGQARTLREHTYYRRMEEFVQLLAPLVANRTL